MAFLKTTLLLLLTVLALSLSSSSEAALTQADDQELAKLLKKAVEDAKRKEQQHDREEDEFNNLEEAEADLLQSENVPSSDLHGGDEPIGGEQSALRGNIARFPSGENRIVDEDDSAAPAEKRSRVKVLRMRTRSSPSVVISKRSPFLFGRRRRKSKVGGRRKSKVGGRRRRWFRKNIMKIGGIAGKMATFCQRYAFICNLVGK